MVHRGLRYVPAAYAVWLEGKQQQTTVCVSRFMYVLAACTVSLVRGVAGSDLKFRISRPRSEIISVTVR